MSLPTKAKVVIIGGGIHGLSTAWKLSEKYKNPNDIVVLEKKDTAAGASGIACGVVRNNYFQPAMRKLMAHSVEVWESDIKNFRYNPVGYMQISPEVMHEDVASIYQQQKDIGYDSVFIEGEKDCMNYMKGIFDDWQAKNITSVLHEKKGGYAFNKDSIKAIEKKAKNICFEGPGALSKGPGWLTRMADRPACSTGTWIAADQPDQLAEPAGQAGSGCWSSRLTNHFI